MGVLVPDNKILQKPQGGPHGKKRDFLESIFFQFWCLAWRENHQPRARSKFFFSGRRISYRRIAWRNLALWVARWAPNPSFSMKNSASRGRCTWLDAVLADRRHVSLGPNTSGTSCYRSAGRRHRRYWHSRVAYNTLLLKFEREYKLLSVYWPFIAV